MKNGVRLLAICLLATALPSMAWAQTSTDRSEMDQFMKDTANQGTPPAPGTKITMQNWQQYKNFMPMGMTKFFEGTYFWKMPADFEMEIGSAIGNNVPQTYIAATEKYAAQTSFELLPNGHYKLVNYHGGVPFPNPQEPHRGWKALANNFIGAYGPALYVNTPNNYGTVWIQDRYGNINSSTFDVVYRYSDYITDPGFPTTETYAPGTWYTEWAMQESPEQARYTASVQMFYKDQEANPYADTFVFVPALRRSLRLSSTARCSPVFGLDWTYDDAKGNGFNGGTSVYDADYLGDRSVIALKHFNSDGAIFPGNYFMPIGFPKPSWGKWEMVPTAVIDVHRIPSEAAGYCYGNRVMWVDKELWWSTWSDLYDSNHKLWKMQFWGAEIRDLPGSGLPGHTVGGASAVSWDVQNSHATYWSGMGNPWKREPYINNQVPKEYRDGVKYGSPSGLMQILR
jgi:hypothetical protein